MESEIISEGKCIFCNEIHPQKKIRAHLAKMEKEDIAKSPKAYYHIVVEYGVQFLHLLVKGTAPMSEIDDFLRAIWLECCGHMSDFRGKDFEINMKEKVQDVFHSKIKIQHTYDYGSTTEVDLKGLKSYNLNHKENIILLSRNEPLKLKCDKCKKQTAKCMCTCCNYDYFCEKCASQHEKECEDFSDYAKMPIVNSPRNGVCSYGGGTIDIERD